MPRTNASNIAPLARELSDLQNLTIWRNAPTLKTTTVGKHFADDNELSAHFRQLLEGPGMPATN